MNSFDLPTELQYCSPADHNYRLYSLYIVRAPFMSLCRCILLAAFYLKDLLPARAY